MQIKKLFAVMMIALLTFMTIATGQVAHATAEDSKTGSLTIHKYEVEPGKEDGADGNGSAGQGVPDGAKTLEGVEYTIVQTHSYNASTDKWTEISGATPLIRVTGDGGIATYEGLELGRYTVNETNGPAHVNLNPDSYSVDIPMTSTDGTDLNYDVHIYPKNEVIRGAVELLKRDAESENTGPLAGVKFKLYHDEGETENGTEVYPDTIYETDANGLIQVEGLAFGEYYFVEVSTLEKYVLQSGRYKFSIKNSGSFVGETGTIVKVFVDNYYKPDIEKEVDQPDANRGDTVTYTLTIDLPGDIKDYNSFVITDVLNPNLTYVAGSEVSPDGFSFTDTEQTLKWTATDFKKLEGGQVTITFDAKIAEDAEVTTIGNTATINYENESGTTGDKETPPTVVTLTDGGFKVVKVDAADKAKTLAGAEFKLIDEEDNTIDASGTLITVNGVAYTGLLENLVTNSDGEIKIDGLDTGTYYLVETKAPTYMDGNVEKSYRLLTQPIKVEIADEDSSSTTTVTVENSKSGWELPKTGGFGTTVFTFVGLLLMAGAIYIYSRREKSAVK